MGDFGYTCAKSRPTKDQGNGPANKKKFNMQQENNAIVKSEVD